MLGGVIFGGLSDRFGRKWIMLFCLYGQCIIGIVLHFVQRLVVFIGLRFIQGVLIQVLSSQLLFVLTVLLAGAAVCYLQHDYGIVLPELENSGWLCR